MYWRKDPNALRIPKFDIDLVIIIPKLGMNLVIL